MASLSAAMALIIFIFWPASIKPSGRFLGQSALVESDGVDSTEYFQRIAGADWLQQPPKSRPELIVRLTEVLNDCEILINAEHSVLSATEREWFVQKCQKWRDKFAVTLSSLDAGEVEYSQTLAESSTTMQKLVNVLNAGPENLAG